MTSSAPLTPGGPSRRVLLRAAGLGGSVLTLTAVAGCGVRLEHQPAPTPAARVPVTDEAALLRVLTVTSFLAPLAARTRPGSPTTTRLAALQQAQAGVVRDRLRTAGVPDAVTGAAGAPTAPPAQTPAPAPDTSASPTTTSSAPTTVTVTVAVLGAAETAALTGDLLVVLPRLSTANRPLVAAIASCAAAGAVELGRPVAWPAADALPGAAAAVLLDSSRAAAYGLEVAAARLDGDERAAVLATLGTVRHRELSLLAAAGRSARPAPLGYPLPFPLDGVAAVRRLVAHVLTGLVASGLDPLTAGTIADGSSATTTVVRLQADAVGMARTWGVSPTAFPGMIAA